MTESKARLRSARAADRDIAAVRRFNRLYTRTIGVLQEGLHDSEFTLAQARVLYELAHSDRPGATAIAADLRLDPGYLSRIVDGFARRGLVARRRATDDARRRSLALTTRGRRAFAPLETRADAEAARLLRRLAVAERRRLVAAMRTIAVLLGDEPSGDRTPVTIRAHRPGDLGWIVSRHGALYTGEHGFDPRIEALAAEVAAQFIRSHDSKRERCWIAERGGERVGAVLLVRHAASVAQLRLLFVEPDARGLGIGGRLVATCIRFARAAGYRRMTLWTNDMLHAARHIYERAGFRLNAEAPHEDFGRRMIGQTWDLDLRHTAS